MAVMSGHGSEHSRLTAASVILLCFASGATDVLSYLTLGRIFTSAMTGCAALFFLTLVGQQYPAAIRAGVALLSYMLGCVCAVALQPANQDEAGAPRSMRRLLVLECLLLGSYTAAAMLGPQPAAGGLRYGLIVLSATAMGVQSIVARTLNQTGITTVVLNLTMTSLMVAATNCVLHRDPELPRRNKLQLMVLAGYSIGAALAAVGLLRHFPAVDLLPLAAAFCALMLWQCRLL